MSWCGGGEMRPTPGVEWRTFAIVVLGGFGSLPGAVLGGVLIGLIEQYAGVYLPDGFKDIAPYLVLIAVLLLAAGLSDCASEGFVAAAAPPPPPPPLERGV